jgi:hypothetical protein
LVWNDRNLCISTVTKKRSRPYILWLRHSIDLTEQNMSRVFNFRSGCLHALHFLHNVAIRSNLKLKTQPKQLLSYLPLNIAPRSIIRHQLFFTNFTFTKITMTFWTRSNLIKLITSQNYKFSSLTRVVVQGRPFQPTLMLID